MSGFKLAFKNTTPGGHGLPPRVYYPSNEGSGADRIINGIEGLITSGIPHKLGPRRWLDNTIYTPSAGPQSFDATYGGPGAEDKFFLHLSFLAPGVDLHDGNFGLESGLQGVTLQGNSSIASKLQGIWGGGVFSKVGSAVAPQAGPGTSLEVSPYFEDSITSGGLPSRIIILMRNLLSSGRKKRRKKKPILV